MASAQAPAKVAMALTAAPTPQSRTVRLIKEALSKLEEGSPAYESLCEAAASAEGLDPYLEKLSTPIIVPSTHSVPEQEVRAVYADLMQATETTDWHSLYTEKKTQFELQKGMCSGAYEASVLQHLALNAGTKTVLEIGLFTGTTSLALALLPNVESVVCLDIEPYLETFDRPFWEKAGVSQKIVTKFGPAINTLKALKKEHQTQFDMVFIDADKPSYRAYVESLLDLDLLAPNGSILADNTLYKGYVYSQSDNPVTPSVKTKSNNKSHGEATQGIIDFNNFVRDDPRLEVVILPVRDGVSIIRRKI